MTKLHAWRWGVAFALLVALPWLVFLADRGLSTGRVLRGVWVGSVSLAGLDRDATRQAVEKLSHRLQTRVLHVRVGDALLTAKPKDLGFALDVDATTESAFLAGRSGGGLERLRWWVASWTRPLHVAPVARLNANAADRMIGKLEKQGVDDPPFDGRVKIENGKPVPEYPRRGFVVDREGAKARIVNALMTEHGEVVDLPLVEVAPRLERTAVDGAVESAKKLLKGDVHLLSPDTDDEVTLTADDLAAALASRSHATSRPYLELYFDADKLDAKLKPIREGIERDPVPATFKVDRRDEIHIIPDRPGIRLDPVLMADAVLYAAASPGRRGVLPLDRAARADLTTEEARALGVKELVSQFSTFHPCCRPRVKNIHNIAELIDGVVVKPGETFSVNEHVGPRTRKNGFVPAPTIENGEMVDSLGGGISQFATTMFNAVLRGGYGIVERQPHSYYFARYPMGHEATLSYPKPDLKFKNDTKAGMLIKCEYGKKFIRVKIFGDKEGRKVATHKGPRTNIKQPPVEYIANPEIDPEEEEVAERGQLGWTVVVSRTVVYADGTKNQEKRKVVYNPRVRRLEVHPCRIPEGEDGFTGEDCPVPEDEADEPEAEESEEHGTALDGIEPESDLDEGH